MVADSKKYGKMDNEICIKYNFNKDYSYLEELIKKWYNSIKAEKGLCLAISRKAPRLIDWCRMKFDYTSKNNLPVITELALPFVDIKNYSGNCIVVDEAIYHGTTFKKVTSITETVCRDNPSLFVKAKPVVVTEEALLSQEIRSRLHTETIISRNDCQFFVDSVISKFLEIGKPYDIEYPLFYVDFKDEITSGQINTLLKELAAIESQQKGLNQETDCIFYETKTYSREAKKSFSSFSYLTEYLYKGRYGRNKPEFSKIRLVYKGNRLCIASMSPYILSSDDLTEANGMLVGDMKEIWIKLFYSIEYPNADDEEYRYQVNKSLVVMTNYLLSFANFIRIKDSIEKAISKVDMHVSHDFEHINDSMFKMDINDLTYLVGNNMGEILSYDFKNLLRSSCQIDQEITPSPIFADIQYNLIPSEYQNDYEAQMSSDNIHSSNHSVSAMMSSMFSAMHTQIELPSRYKKKTFDRLRFGETYRSIVDRFSIYCPAKLEMYKSIHQCMDKRIDSGSAVPNYVRRDASFGNNYWLRMFRSGENEDYNKDRILRNILAVIHYFLKYNMGTILHSFDFEFLMALLNNEESLENQSERISHLWGRELITVFNEGMYQTCVQLEDGKIVGLIDYAKDYQLLSEDGQHFLTLSNNSYVKNLNDGNVWTQAEESLINDYVSFVYQFSQRYTDPMLIRETLNYYFYEKLDFIGDLLQWIGQLMEDINIGHWINLDKKEKEFKKLYERIPEPFLKLTKEDISDNSPKIEALASNIIACVNKHKNEILEKLIFERLYLSYYILNLWSYYTDMKTTFDFKINDYLGCFDFLAINDFKFSDDKSMYLWLKETATFENRHNIALSEMQYRLSQILDKLMLIEAN